MTTVSIYGAGQLGSAVAQLLRTRPATDVRGPFGREDRAAALTGGADVVVIATTTRLADVLPDIAAAIASGSNVITSAEEAAHPSALDATATTEIDSLARAAGVTILGGGLNPGFLFDALVLTLLGAAPAGCMIHVRRVVDISGFGAVVLRRIGVGLSPDAFDQGVSGEAVFGHAGFPQSIKVVADAMALPLERVDRILRPVISDREISVSGHTTIHSGESAGVDQRYTGIVDGRPWFTAEFFGHVRLEDLGLERSDDIELLLGESVYQRTSIRPGVDAQVGSANMIANSIERVRDATPGWLTVADLPPAYPRISSTPVV
jgi:4-hydroxy-tetrahydrodipicolinate reductase